MPNFKTNFFTKSDDNNFLDYSDIFNKYNEDNKDKIDIDKLNGFNNLKLFILNNQRLKELFFIDEDNDIKYTFLHALIEILLESIFLNLEQNIITTNINNCFYQFLTTYLPIKST